jgi:membrane fusion protein, multidrug efflux system
MAEETESKPKKKILPIILAVIIIASAAFGITKYIYSAHHEDTDDAQVDADISPVLARVSGYVNEIRFEDNQRVKAGDTLIKLDDRDLSIKVLQAEAAAVNASAMITAAKANVETSRANLETVKSNNEDAAKIRLWKATADYNRYEKLLAEKSVTQQQFDVVKAEKEAAENALQAAMKQEASNVAQVHAAEEQVAVAESQLKQKQADLDYAKLQLTYASILAPASGIASRKNVQPGQLVNVGSPLFAIVGDSGIYVLANFKETQLTKMKEGLEVKVVADAFPDKDVSGTVYRLSAATGAKFSLLPPDNATGNFVKVVQRVPVKIKLNADKETLALLRPGMSVKVSVKLD